MSLPDEIKSAIYNLKEFRRGRFCSTKPFAEAACRKINWVKLWIAVVIFTGIAIGAAYILEQNRAKLEVPLPVSGEYQRFYPPTVAAPAIFKISAKSSTSHFFVKLEDWKTTAPVVTVFVRKGEEVTINVPLGEYRLKYASGTNWMGPEALFGVETSSSQAVEPITFRAAGNQYLWHIIDLAP